MKLVEEEVVHRDRRSTLRQMIRNLFSMEWHKGECKHLLLDLGSNSFLRMGFAIYYAGLFNFDMMEYR